MTPERSNVYRNIEMVFIRSTSWQIEYSKNKWHGHKQLNPSDSLTNISCYVFRDFNK